MLVDDRPFSNVGERVLVRIPEGYTVRSPEPVELTAKKMAQMVVEHIRNDPDALRRLAEAIVDVKPS